MDALLVADGRALQGVFDLGQQTRHVVPGRGRLQGVHGIAHVPQRVAQVRRAEAALHPLVAEASPGGDAAMGPAQVKYLLPRGAGVGGAAGEATQQHALTLAHAANAEQRLQQTDQPLVAGQGQRRLRLARRAQPQQRQRPAPLYDLAHSGHPGGELREEDGVELLVLRQRRHADGGLGQDAQPPLRAKHQLAQVGAGGRGGEGRQAQRAGGRQQRAAGKQALDAAIAQRLLAAGACGHPAAQGGVLERLREVAQGEAARPQLGLQFGAGHARAERGQVTDAVEAQKLVHAPQVDR